MLLKNNVLSFVEKFAILLFTGFYMYIFGRFFSTVYRRVSRRAFFGVFKYPGSGYGANAVKKKIGPSNLFAATALHCADAQNGLKPFRGRTTVINNPACRDRTRQWFKRIFTISSLFFYFSSAWSAVFSGKISSYPTAPSVTVRTREQNPVPEISTRFPTTVTTTNRRHLPNNKRGWGVNGEGRKTETTTRDNTFYVRLGSLSLFPAVFTSPVSRGHGRGTWPTSTRKCVNSAV